MKQDIKEGLLSQEYLKKLLYYSPDTGVFTWKERPVSMFSHCQDPQHQRHAWNTRFSEKKAGCKRTPKESKTSYLAIGISLNGKCRLYFAHRLAILYTDGHLPLEQVDHIDGNGLNNRRNNLREVSDGENKKNKPIYSTNTSGAVGVFWNKPAQKWQAQIQINGKHISGGYFTNKEDAIARRKQMEIEYNFHKNHGRE
jgi:hypothetical protein